MSPASLRLRLPLPALPRVRLFEVNDAPWAPPFVRELIVEMLSATLERGRLLDGLVDPIADFLTACGTDAVLDLCSGAGGPARILVQALASRGVAARFTLTDLHPRVSTWERIARDCPGLVDHVAASVDATAIPAGLSAGKARVIVNALHHFPPELVRGIFADAARSGSGIFVSESFTRNPLAALNILPVGLPVMLRAPLTGRDRFAKALLVWGSPVGAAISLWDTVVSTLRVYDEAELRSFTAGLDTFDWRFGTYPVGPFGGGTWFSGTPRG